MDTNILILIPCGILTLFLLTLIAILERKCNAHQEMLKELKDKINEKSTHVLELKNKLDEKNDFILTLESELKKAKKNIEIQLADIVRKEKLLTMEQSLANAKNNELFWERQKFQKEKDKVIDETKKEIKSAFSFHPELVTPFLEGLNEGDYYNSIMQGVLQHAFENPPRVVKIDIYAKIHSATSDRIYRTTLNECSCPDNGCRHRPCKHMLYLAYLLGLLQINQKDRDSIVRETSNASARLIGIQAKENELNSRFTKLQHNYNLLNQRTIDLEKRRLDIQSEVDEIINGAIAEATEIISSARSESKKKNKKLYKGDLL